MKGYMNMLKKVIYRMGYGLEASGIFLFLLY
jgi:hypothetical protein